jgi:carboxymethylenebutenolidase
MLTTTTLTLAFLLALFVPSARGQTPIGEQVAFSNGALKLGGFIAKPAGKGPFPAVVWNHGSGSNPNPRISRLASFWVSHGFVFFEPHRRGYGLSASAGPDIQDTVDQIAKRAGAEAGDLVKTQLLATEQLDDQMAGIAWLRAVPEVNPDRIATMGISFGGVQALLAAERGDGIRVAVSFAGGAMNWMHNVPMRARLLEAARNAKVPVMFLQAENDFDLGPSRELFAEMTRVGKVTALRIYPPQGRTVLDGHTFAGRSPELWWEDVRAFIAPHMGLQPDGR